MDENNNVEKIDSHILAKYEIIQKLGKGAYGVVWKALDKKTRKIIALKKVFDAFHNLTDAQRTYREVMFLFAIDGHENIISLKQIIEADNDKDLYMIFDFMETDLHHVIRANILQNIHKQFIIAQILGAVKYMHDGELIHRDLKPANILLNSECQVKLADFGLARSIHQKQNDQNIMYTDYVATRWYRAPEILFGSTEYSKPVDMWSIGCILGELILNKAIFAGTSTLNQIELVLEMTGNLSKEDILSLKSNVSEKIIKTIPIVKQKQWNQVFACDPNTLDILKKLLLFNQNNRLTVNEALQHQYVEEFKDQIYLSKSKKLFKIPMDEQKETIERYRNALYAKVKSMRSQIKEDYIKRSSPRQKSSIKSKEPEIRKNSYQTQQSKNQLNSQQSNHDLDQQRLKQQYQQQQQKLKEKQQERQTKQLEHRQSSHISQNYLQNKIKQSVNPGEEIKSSKNAIQNRSVLNKQYSAIDSGINAKSYIQNQSIHQFPNSIQQYNKFQNSNVTKNSFYLKNQGNQQLYSNNFQQNRTSMQMQKNDNILQSGVNTSVDKQLPGIKQQQNQDIQQYKTESQQEKYEKESTGYQNGLLQQQQQMNQQYNKFSANSTPSNNVQQYHFNNKVYQHTPPNYNVNKNRSIYQIKDENNTSKQYQQNNFFQNKQQKAISPYISNNHNSNGNYSKFNYNKNNYQKVQSNALQYNQISQINQNNQYQPKSINQQVQGGLNNYQSCYGNYKRQTINNKF